MRAQELVGDASTLDRGLQPLRVSETRRASDALVRDRHQDRALLVQHHGIAIRQHKHHLLDTRQALQLSECARRRQVSNEKYQVQRRRSIDDEDDESPVCHATIAID